MADGKCSLGVEAQEGKVKGNSEVRAKDMHEVEEESETFRIAQEYIVGFEPRVLE